LDQKKSYEYLEAAAKPESSGHGIQGQFVFRYSDIALLWYATFLKTQQFVTATVVRMGHMVAFYTSICPVF
jgi:hypothetical protein